MFFITFDKNKPRVKTAAAGTTNTTVHAVTAITITTAIMPESKAGINR